MESDLKKSESPTVSNPTSASMPGTVEEGNVGEIGDNELLGRRIEIGYEKKTVTDTKDSRSSQAWLQAGAATTVLNHPSLCHCVQYHGTAPLDCFDPFILDAGGPCRDGMGMALSELFHLTGWIGHGRVSSIRSARSPLTELQADLASAMPTAGGLYFWTHYFTTEKYRNPLSFVVGYSNTIGLVGGVCSIDCMGLPSWWKNTVRSGLTRNEQMDSP